MPSTMSSGLQPYRPLSRLSLTRICFLVPIVFFQVISFTLNIPIQCWHGCLATIYIYLFNSSSYFCLTSQSFLVPCFVLRLAIANQHDCASCLLFLAQINQLEPVRQRESLKRGVGEGSWLSGIDIILSLVSS